MGQKLNLRGRIGRYVDEMIQANNFVVLKRFDVATSVPSHVV